MPEHALTEQVGTAGRSGRIVAQATRVLRRYQRLAITVAVGVALVRLGDGSCVADDPQGAMAPAHRPLVQAAP